MKRLFAFLAAMLVMAGTVNALGLPQPFVVHLNADTYSDTVGVEVTITDMTHPYTMVLNTNEYGEAAGDWSAAKVAGYEGDKFVITAGGKTVDAVLNNAGIQDLKGNDIIQIYLTSEPKAECTDTTPYDEVACKANFPGTNTITTNTEYVCYDGTTLKENKCPAPPVKECPEVVSGEVTIDAILAFFAFLVTLGILFGGYKGYFQFNVREKYINSRGLTAYRWKTIFSKTSAGEKKPVS